MKIGVVGNGVVGNATARSYMEFGEVLVYDSIPWKSPHRLEQVLDSDLVFLCLPTPHIGVKGQLGYDLSILNDFCKMLGGTAPNGNYVLRSTVPVGTTKRLSAEYGLTNLCHSPEFLTARCAVTDAHVPARNIIGRVGGSGDALLKLYRERFHATPTYLMTSDESEAVKLFVNGFFAVKVAYFNEIRSLSDALGLDWEQVTDGMLSDGRIAHSHTKVPGPDGRYGFGGACLPKDLSALVAMLYENGLQACVTDGARLRNSLDRGKPGV